MALGLRATLVDDRQFIVALRSAAIAADFPNPEITSEPLAVLAYHAAAGDLGQPPQVGRYLIINCGGAWTEMVVVEMSEDGGPPRVGAALADRYGGQKFDQVLANFIRQNYAGPNATAQLNELELLHFTRSFKESFSEQIKAGERQYERYCALPGIQTGVTLSQSDFEHMEVAGSLIETFPSLLLRVLQKNGLSAPQVTRVLLAGGSSRWYFVGQAVRDLFGPERIVVAGRPDETVVKGLALSLAPLDVGRRLLQDHAQDEPVTATNTPAPIRDSRPPLVPHLIPSSLPPVAERLEPVQEMQSRLIHEQPLAHPAPQSAARHRSPSPKKAFALELLGLLAFLGIGWIYAGRVVTGVMLLVLWWGALIVGGPTLIGLALIRAEWLFVLLLFGCWIGVPMLSGVFAARHARKKRL